MDPKIIVELRLHTNDILTSIYKLMKIYIHNTITYKKIVNNQNVILNKFSEILKKVTRLKFLCIIKKSENNFLNTDQKNFLERNIKKIDSILIPNSTEGILNSVLQYIKLCNDILETLPLPLAPSLPLPREIKHFWYRGWPDHGVPDLFIEIDNSIEVKKENEDNFKIFDKFIDNLNNDIKKNGGNTVIHCSAGVGRSGVIYVILMLLNNRKIKTVSRENLIILIYETIDKAREERVSIVQSSEQFSFIVYYLSHKFKINLSNPFAETNTTSNLITIELLKLFENNESGNTINILKNRKDQENSILKDVKCKNKTLNRYSDMLPYIHTNITVDGKVIQEDCSNYINASRMSSIPNPNPNPKHVIIKQEHIHYDIPMNNSNNSNISNNSNNSNSNENNNFTVIITQGPKDETTLNFRKMLNTYNTKRIVMVTNLMEGYRYKCHSYVNVYDNDSDISNGEINNMDELPNLLELDKPMYNTLTLDGNVDNLNLYMVKDKSQVSSSRKSSSRRSSSNSRSLQNVSSIRRRFQTKKTSLPRTSLPPKRPSKTNFYLTERFSQEFNNSKNNELIKEITNASHRKNNKTKTNLKSNSKTKKYTNKELKKVKTLEEFKVLIDAYYNKSAMNVLGYTTDTIKTLKTKFEQMIFNKILEIQRALRNKNAINYRRASENITKMYNDYNENEEITTFTSFIEESHHLLEEFDNFMKKFRHLHTANSELITQIDKQKKKDKEIKKIKSGTYMNPYQNKMSRIDYTYMPFQELNRLTSEDITKITLHEFQDLSNYYKNSNKSSWSNYIDIEIKKQFRKRVINLAKHFYLDMIKRELQKTTPKPKNLVTIVKESLINEMKHYDFVTKNEMSDTFFKDMNVFINACLTTDSVKFYNDEDKDIPYYGFHSDY